MKCVDCICCCHHRSLKPTSSGTTALTAAAENGHADVVSYLLIAGGNPNQMSGNDDRFQNSDDELAAKMPPIVRAAAYGDAKVVKALLEARANPNGATVSGYAALHSACSMGSDESVKLLLDARADIKMTSATLFRYMTSSGLTPLHCACNSGHATTITLLLERRADLNAEQKLSIGAFTGRVHPIHLACRCSGADEILALAAFKADVNRRLRWLGGSLSPLIFAAFMNNAATVEVLLELRADVNFQASGLRLRLLLGSGDALAFANQFERKEVITILEEFDRKVPTSK